MSRFRILLTLPVAAAAAAGLMASAVPASAAPVTAGPTKAAVRITPSLVLDLTMVGGCTGATDDPKSVLAMQRINWMWAPIALDGAPNPPMEPNVTPLAKVLIPNTIEPAGQGMRQRHDLAPGEHFTAPGPTRQSPTTCVFAGVTEQGPFTLTIKGTVVTIPKWLDALQPLIQPPPQPIQQP